MATPSSVVYVTSKQSFFSINKFCPQERKSAKASKEAIRQLHSESQRLVRGQSIRIRSLCGTFFSVS